MSLIVSTFQIRSMDEIGERERERERELANE